MSSVSDLHSLKQQSPKASENFRVSPPIPSTETTVEEVVHLKKLLNFEALEESIANGEFEKVFPKKRALPPPLRSHQREKEILARGPRRTEGAEM